MFGRKKRDQIIEGISTNIATLIEMSLWSAKYLGELPTTVEKDEFVLGYIYGVASAGAFAVGIKKLADRHSIITFVFDHLFSGKGAELLNGCLRLYEPERVDKSAPIFKAMELGIDESAPVFKAMLAGDLEPVHHFGALASLDDHLDKTYL